jgi:hypothetical protein
MCCAGFRLPRIQSATRGTRVSKSWVPTGNELGADRKPVLYLQDAPEGWVQSGRQLRLRSTAANCSLTLVTNPWNPALGTHTIFGSDEVVCATTV